MFSLRRQLSPLVMLALVAALLVVLDQLGSLQQPQSLVRDAAIPVERQIARASEAVQEGVFVVRHLATLRRENERLRRELEQLAPLRVRLIELENENRQLREMLAFKRERPNYLLLVAEVVARERPALVTSGDPNPLVQAVRIDQGRAQGVEPGMPVITARGLVGRVIDVGNQWAVVKLLTDESMSVAALDQQSRAAGVVQGTGDTLIMRFIPHDQNVEEGDVIITSGLGGNFPKGLVIGTVQSVRQQDIAPYQEATLASPVDFTNLEYVFVIRAFSAGEGEE
ncbi:MAG: rod shape-determining protein MreC [Ardenticatenia bacterium]|nr:rod shape-determining protein MreC [Ardenticatenia bacterium]